MISWALCSILIPQFVVDEASFAMLQWVELSIFLFGFLLFMCSFDDIHSLAVDQEQPELSNEILDALNPSNKCVS